jgi:hypothetical protein
MTWHNVSGGIRPGLPEPAAGKPVPPGIVTLLQNLRPSDGLKASTRLRRVECVSRAAWLVSGGHGSVTTTHYSCRLRFSSESLRPFSAVWYSPVIVTTDF